VIDLSLIPSEAAAAALPRLWHMDGFERMLEAKYRPGDLQGDLFHGKLQLWCISEGPQILGICFTYVTTFPLKKVCTITGVCGTGIRRWMDKISGIEDWAKAQNCTEVEVEGREGWIKLLPQYAKSRVTLVKKLHDA